MQLKPVSITDFKGLNEVTDPLHLDPGAATAMRNTLVTKHSAMKTRDGYTSVGTGGTEFYSTHNGKRAYLIDATGDLYRVDEQGAQALVASLGVGTYYWAEMGDHIVISGSKFGVLRNGAWTEYPKAPALGPTIHTTSDNSNAMGRSPGGTVIAVSTRVVDGIESPASPVRERTIDQGSNLRVSGASHPEGDRTYVSELGDSVMTHGGAAIDPAVLKGSDWPECTYVAWFDSRVWRAEYSQGQDTTFIYPSAVFRPAICDLGEYLPIPGEVTMMATVEKVMVIATYSRIYAYDGSSLTELADFGCLPHRRVAYDKDKNLWFWTDRGMAKALPFELVTEETVQTVAADTVTVQRLRDPDGDQIVVFFNESA